MIASTVQEKEVDYSVFSEVTLTTMNREMTLQLQRVWRQLRMSG